VAQRVVTFQSLPRTDQQPEPVIKAITHFTGGHRRHPRGGQFDGQWNPIQALTNLGDCGRFRHRLSRSPTQCLGRVRRTGSPPQSRFPLPCPETAVTGSEIGVLLDDIQTFDRVLRYKQGHV